MKTLATYNKVNGEPSPVSYGLTPNDNLHWDEEEMYGCACDDGFTGYDCSQRMCPFGDDPYTLHQENHQRVLKCTGSSGSFKIKFRGPFKLGASKGFMRPFRLISELKLATSYEVQRTQPSEMS